MKPPADTTSSPQALARRQERIEQLCAAAMRALSGERDLHFRARRVFRGALPLPPWAPHLNPPLATADFDVFRGAADAIALRLLHSDTELHRRHQPPDAVERMLFDGFEQLRVESQAPAAMPGLRHNLARCFRSWSESFHAAGHNATARGLLLYTVVQMVRARLTGEEAIEPDEGLLEATRAGLGPAIGVELAALRRHAADQARYASHALAIARRVAQMLRTADEEDGGAAEGSDDEPDDRRTAFNFWIEQDLQAAERAAPAHSGESAVLQGTAGGYRPFTTAYDREVEAAALVRREQLAQLRAQLDAGIESARVNLAHLARDLKALLARPTADGWDGAMEEGRIDGRRLAQLVASPTERRLFRTERIEPLADCLVTLLIDCSGSMREQAAEVALLVDLLARALEMAGVASEVLGYTTGAWNGGRAQRDWLRAGRPRHPGRLNERLHIVFKDGDTPWRRARPAMAALLQADLFRESIDGEAVAWALQRQADRRASHAQERQLLIVVSDGSPMDSATNLANDLHYLDHHLRDVVARAQASGREIIGLGVGPDLSPYYGRSHVLDLAGGLRMPALREVLAVLGRGPRR